MMKVLSISAAPDRKSLAGRVDSTSGQMYVKSGWRITPIMFFSDSKLTPVLPPMAASTWDSSVVGMKAKRMPRL